MAFTFEQIIAGAPPTGGDSGSEFTRKINDNFAKLTTVNVATGIALSATNVTKYGVSTVDDALLNIANSDNTRSQLFTANGTFTVPSGVTKLAVYACAAGSSIGDGKAGAYLLGKVFTVTPGQTLTVVCGSGNTTITELSVSLVAASIAESLSTDILGFVTGMAGANGSSTDGGVGVGPYGTSGDKVNFKFKSKFKAIDGYQFTTSGSVSPISAGGSGFSLSTAHGGAFGYGGCSGSLSGFTTGGAASGFGAAGGNGTPQME